MVRRTLVTLAALALVGAAAFAQPVVDGAITEGEYANTLAHADSGANLYWTVDGDTLRMGFTMASNGWAGIGWLGEQTNRKAGGEILIATMADGGAVVYDMFQAAARGEPEMDADNRFADAVATYTDGVWTVEFATALDTGDALDVPVTVGTPMFVMVAHGNTMDPGQRHPRDARWYIENFVF